MIETRAEVVAPFGPDGTLDIDVANGDLDGGLHYVDVNFALPSGAELDYDSVLDTTPEIALSGSGLAGAVAVEGRPLPVELIADEDGVLRPHVVAVTYESGHLTAASIEELRIKGITRFRYRFTTAVDYQVGAVTITFTADGWQDQAGNTVAQAPRTIQIVGPGGSVANPGAGTGIDRDTLNDRNWIDVTFAAGVDELSVTDLTPEFALSGPDLGTIALDPAQRPVKLGATTYRYFLTGTFANGDAAADDGLDDIVLTFLPNSFTGGGATTPAPVAYQNLHATNTRSYIDIRFDPTAAGRKAGTAPATLAGRIDADSILDPGDEFTLTGAAVSGFAFDATREVVAVGDGVYRYFFTATFGTGAVTVDFDGAEWETNAGTTGHGPDETFTVLGPTGTLGDPGDQASTGPQNLNGRGYLDVGITAPAGKTLDLATVYDEAAEFALKGAGGTALAGLQLDAGQTPLLLRRTGNTWFFRYWTRGTYTSGPVTIDFTPGGYGFTDATVTDGAADTTPVDFTVGGVATPNIGWLDVILAPTSAGQLVTATITDAEAEFSLSGTGVGTAALLGAAAPTRLGTSGTWRYYFTGDFRTGDVDVTFGPGTFQSGAARRRPRRTSGTSPTRRRSSWSRSRPSSATRRWARSRGPTRSTGAASSRSPSPSRRTRPGSTSRRSPTSRRSSRSPRRASSSTPTGRRS